MMNFSLTYVGALVLVLTGVFQLVGAEVASEEIEIFLKVGGLLIGALVTLYGRYRAGGINIFGVKTKNK
jgi:hypothetical protein